MSGEEKLECRELSEGGGKQKTEGFMYVQEGRRRWGKPESASKRTLCPHSAPHPRAQKGGEVRLRT